MKIDNYGIILNVEHFDACVRFYKDVFGLPEMFSKTEGDFRLTCLEFGNAYLMIETEGVAVPSGKDVSRCPTKLRFNVPDIHQARASLHQHGIEAEVMDNDWGSIITLYDPDGNRISIRDEAGFRAQADSQ